MIDFCSSLMFSMTTSSPVSGPIVRICRGCVRTSPSPHPDGSRSHQWPRQHPHSKRMLAFASVFHSVPLEVFILNTNKSPKNWWVTRPFFPTSQEAAFSNKVSTRAWRRPPPPPLENFSSCQEFLLEQCSLFDPKNYQQKPSFFTGKATLKSSTSTIPAASLHLFFIVSVSS